MTAADRAGFLAAILADPGCDTARLAYADALRESDDAFDRARPVHGPRRPGTRPARTTC